MNKFKLLTLAILAPFAYSQISFSAAAPESTQASSSVSGASGRVGGSASQLLSAQFATQILQPSKINNRGYHNISKSGYYVLSEDMHFLPTNFTNDAITGTGILGVSDDEYAAIYITADNVTLDLNGYSIVTKSYKATPTDYTTRGCDAIMVAPGVKNVTIKNGSIGFTTGYGIHVAASAVDGETANVTIADMTIMNCPYAGILVGRAVGDDPSDQTVNTGAEVFGVVIDNVTVSHCQGTGLSGPNDALVFAGSGRAVGIILDNVVQAHLKNVSSCNNHVDTTDETKTTIGDFAAGLWIQDSENIEVSNSIFSNNKGPFAYGMNIVSSSNVSVIDSKMLRNAHSIPTGLTASNKSIVAGASLSGSTLCAFENCQANKNSLDGIIAENAAGFYLEGRIDSPSSNNTFSRCLAAENVGGSTITTISFGAGFLSVGLAEARNTGNRFLGCSARGNTVGDRDTGYAAGIALYYSDSDIIEGCLCVANGNLSDARAAGIGILLGPNNGDTTETRNAMIRDNWLVANSWHGLKDLANDCQSLIMNNYAFRNGLDNAQYSEGNLSAEQLNFYTNYTESTENLPLASATVGGFGALNVATRFANTEIQVTADSLTPGDTGYPSVPDEDEIIT